MKVSALQFVEPTAEALAVTRDRVREAARRRSIVRLVFVVYWLLIFEGALRKWLLPEIQQVLFFIRDPFVIAIYVLALRAGKVRGGFLFQFAISLATVFLFMGGAQIIALGLPLLVVAYGWRNYFFYVPLAFVIYEFLSEQDVQRLFKATLIVAIPLSLLAVAQFFSPTDAFINKGVDEDTAVFEVVAGVVRTYGTFSFALGQALYAVTLFCMLLANVCAPSERRFIGNRTFAVATAATAATIFLCGSRTVFAGCAVCLLSLLVFGLLADGARLGRSLFGPLLLTAVLAVAYPVAFPTAYDAMVQRQETAEAVEGSTVVRAFGTLFSFVDAMNIAPWGGYGLGSGTGGGTMLSSGQQGFGLSEDELSRIVLEVGPLLGIVYIGMRLGLVLFVGFHAIRAAREGRVTSLCFLGFVGWLFTTGQSTLNGTVMGYAWLFAGFALAASKSGGPDATSSLVEKSEAPA
jgi:hypothetical protein